MSQHDASAALQEPVVSTTEICPCDRQPLRFSQALGHRQFSTATLMKLHVYDLSLAASWMSWPIISKTMELKPTMHLRHGELLLFHFSYQ